MYSRVAMNKQGPQKSYGSVNVSTVFGGVDYHGSTLPGCSGGIYTVGERPLAMHLQQSGKNNFGISLSYIACLIAGEYMEKLESDFSKLFERLSGQKKLEYTNHGLDEVIFHLDGLYHTVDRSDAWPFIHQFDEARHDIETGVKEGLNQQEGLKTYAEDALNYSESGDGDSINKTELLQTFQAQTRLQLAAQASDLKTQKLHYDQKFEQHITEVNQLKDQLKEMAVQTAILTLERKELRQSLADVNSVQSTMQKKTPLEKAASSRNRKDRVRERANQDRAELLPLRKMALVAQPPVPKDST